MADISKTIESKQMKSIQKDAECSKGTKNTSKYRVSHLKNQSHPVFRFCGTSYIFENIFRWCHSWSISSMHQKISLNFDRYAYIISAAAALVGHPV